MNRCECSYPDGDHERWCPLNRDLGVTGARHLGKRYRRYDPSCLLTLLWLELLYPDELAALRAEDERVEDDEPQDEQEAPPPYEPLLRAW